MKMKISLFIEGLRDKFLPVGKCVPQKSSLEACGLVPNLQRDKYVTIQELEASLNVSMLFWVVLWYSRVGTLSHGNYPGYGVLPLWGYTC